MALNNACRDSTYDVTNLWAWRREAYLSHLRPTYSQVEKGILWKSPIFSSLLFDEDKLQELVHSSKSNVDMTLHEGLSTTMFCSWHTVGGAWSSSAPSTMPNTSTTQRPVLSSHPKDSWGGSSGFLSFHPSGLGGRRGQGLSGPKVEGVAENWVLDDLREGYRIPLSPLPPTCPSPATQGLQRLCPRISQRTNPSVGALAIELGYQLTEGPFSDGWRSRTWIMANLSSWPSQTSSTDALNDGWGVSLLQDSVSGLWDSQERLLHIIVL
ncbi:hypothetical protein E2C01_039100 [Portunus trituberculatus]|uniref:Uncharacterized protein n=1 Tax=Portunus trituberculatus TaxID=210409 RepID=A0A5B7FFY9_PORTR|nr:hypothetical protein [Portunus trituberculatus]